MNVFFVAFCALPPAILLAKAYFKWRMSTWWFFAGFVMVGWILWFVAIWLRFEDLARQASTPGASDELMDQAQKDGAPRVFALYFGWAFAGLYFGAWTLAYSRGGSLYKRIRAGVTGN